MTDFMSKVLTFLQLREHEMERTGGPTLFILMVGFPGSKKKRRV